MQEMVKDGGDRQSAEFMGEGSVFMLGLSAARPVEARVPTNLHTIQFCIMRA